MFTNPYLGMEIARERQRELLAAAEQQRLVRQLRAMARASRQADRTKQHLGHAGRAIARLRAARA